MSGGMSAARIAANRRNARSSSGPRSAAGKARAAQNSRRHGLSRPAADDPAWAAAIAALARTIAGEGAEPQRLALAYAIAVAHIDVERARQVRRDLYALALQQRDGIRRLAAIDDYEQRALARRKA